MVTICFYQQLHKNHNVSYVVQEHTSLLPEKVCDSDTLSADGIENCKMLHVVNDFLHKINVVP